MLFKKVDKVCEKKGILIVLRTAVKWSFEPRVNPFRTGRGTDPTGDFPRPALPWPSRHQGIWVDLFRAKGKPYSFPSQMNIMIVTGRWANKIAKAVKSDLLRTYLYDQRCLDPN